MAVSKLGRVFRLASLGVTVALLAAGCSHTKVAAKPAAVASPSPSPSPSPPPPPICPLTGEVTPAGVPNRPALAIKVENSPESRPPAGLNGTDIVYEEPVEGGITRFVAMFQCHDASRVEPVRSARQADPYIVNQGGMALFGNSGGSPPTEQAIQSAIKAGWIVDVSDATGGGYHRDSRPSPHNYYTSTAELYGRSNAKGAVPSPVFTYAASPAPGGAGASVHVAFSQYSDVTWRWNATAGVYQRYYGSQPATLQDGGIISAKNLVIQEVAVNMSWWIEDPSGSHQPVPTLQGTGQTLVCRQGTCVTGSWTRPGEGLKQPTYYKDATGADIPLVPGNTWVELAPTSVAGPGPIPVASVTAS